MRPSAPFRAGDLAELDERLLSQALRVVPMRDVFKGDCGDRVIGMRHDVDDNPGAFEAALRMARWEFERGYSSTYFLLHTADYWGEYMLCHVPEFEELGHEVGIHVNAVVEGLRTKRDPARILARALFDLRSTGVRVVGCAGHGDPLCRDADGEVVFTNDEMFVESPRPTLGAPTRLLVYKGHELRLAPLSREVFGLEYDAPWLSRGDYLSDSGGRWAPPFERVVSAFGVGQLHVLIHPDWWTQAFVSEEVAA
jgi:hypothetical protein